LAAARHGILVQHIGCFEGKLVRRAQGRTQPRDLARVHLWRQEAGAIVLAEQDQQVQVRRLLPAAGQLLEADAQRLPLIPRRSAHPPAQIDRLESYARLRAQ
jgi:hypothetical protein